jgi:hypothetical protein
MFAQLPAELKRKFEEAERKIVRLPPRSFAKLPVKVASEMERRGCTVPQEAFTKKPHNVIHGQFGKGAAPDWAVLCSVKGVSRILVFWDGSGQQPSEISEAEDRIYLQTISATDIGFSRGISPVGRDFILKHYRAYGGPKPPPIDHQGIDDAFIEKASVTHYYYEGKWLGLSGAD